MKNKLIIGIATIIILSGGAFALNLAKYGIGNFNLVDTPSSMTLHMYYADEGNVYTNPNTDNQQTFLFTQTNAGWVDCHSESTSTDENIVCMMRSPSQMCTLRVTMPVPAQPNARCLTILTGIVNESNVDYVTLSQHQNFGNFQNSCESKGKAVTITGASSSGVGDSAVYMVQTKTGIQAEASMSCN